MWRWDLTDPALVRQWPRKWLNDPEIAPAIRYLDRYLHDFQRNTTSTTEVINTTIEQNITSVVNQAAFDPAVGLVMASEAFEDDNSVPTVDVRVEKEITTKTITSETYTSVGDEFIKCKGSCTVKLPENPGDNCVVYIHNYDNALVTIDGNGRDINQNDKLFIRRKGNGLQIYYFIDDNEYIAI